MKFLVCLLLFLVTTNCLFAQVDTLFSPTILYKNCLNRVYLESELATKGETHYCKSKDGYVEDSIQNGDFLAICPQKDTFFLHIFKKVDGKKIKIMIIRFLTKNPPKPMIATYINGRLAKNSEEVQNIKQNDSIEIRITPHADFAATMPNEVAYAYESLNIYCSGTHAPAPFKHLYNLKSPIKLKVNTLNYCIINGTNMYIEFSGFHRLNSRGEKIFYKKGNKNFSVWVQNQ